MMTEAVLAACEAICQIKVVERERTLLLEHTLQEMYTHQLTFDAAFLSACRTLRVPDHLYRNHERAIMRARQCVEA